MFIDDFLRSHQIILVTLNQKPKKENLIRLVERIFLQP